MSCCEYGKLDCSNVICKPRTSGKEFPESGTIKDCLQFTKRGKPFNSRRMTPSFVPQITYGNSTLVSIPASQLINPKPKTNFQQNITEKKEQCYQSKLYPIGKSRKLVAYKNSSYVPDNTKSCGIPTLIDISAGEMINSHKTAEQVLTENAKGHKNYVVTHNDYNPGETINRKYDWKGRIPKTIKFGKPTPHCNSGKNMAQVMQWVCKNSPIRHTYIVAKNFDEIKSKVQPLLAKTVDPIADTLKVGLDHTFGLLDTPDECGGGDLIHMRSPRNFLAGQDPKRGWLACVRHHLKQANYRNFKDLKSALKYYDPQDTGYIDAENLRRVCWTFNLPVDNKLLSYLMRECAGVKNEDFDIKTCRIDYVQFVNFLNWENKNFSAFPFHPSPYHNAKPKQKVAHLVKQLDPAITNHVTTSSFIGKEVEQVVKLKKKLSSGIPTIRNDLPAPRLSRISDRKNYGDQADAWGLVNPSVCSKYGVYERDFFELRPREEIFSIFQGAGVKLSNEVFDDLWKKAVKWSSNSLTHHKSDQVSVEAFKSVLDNVQGAAIRKEDPMATTSAFVKKSFGEGVSVNTKI